MQCEINRFKTFEQPLIFSKDEKQLMGTLIFADNITIYILTCQRNINELTPFISNVENMVQT